jgi:hypothetical protein
MARCKVCAKKGATRFFRVGRETLGPFCSGCAKEIGKGIERRGGPAIFGGPGSGNDFVLLDDASANLVTAVHPDGGKALLFFDGADSASAYVKREAGGENVATGGTSSGSPMPNWATSTLTHCAAGSSGSRWLRPKGKRSSR